MQIQESWAYLENRGEPLIKDGWLLNALLFTGVGDINQHLCKQGAGSTWGKTSSCLLEAQGFGPNNRDFSFGSFSKCGSITDYWRKKAGVSNLGPRKNPGGDSLSSCCSVLVARMSDRYPFLPGSALTAQPLPGRTWPGLHGAAPLNCP